MAARRLLIVMLVLLGLSTLAAALVPQHSLRDGTTSATTTTQPPTTTQPAILPRLRPAHQDHGRGQAVPRGLPRQGRPSSWSCWSPRGSPTQLAIREFGQLGFAAPDAPARFELLPTVAGTFGIQFEPSGEVAAKIRVVAPGQEAAEEQKKAKEGRAKSRARGGSDRP